MQVNNVSASNYGVQKNNTPSFGMAVRVQQKLLEGIHDSLTDRGTFDDVVRLAKQKGRNPLRAIKRAESKAASEIKFIRDGVSKRFFPTNGVDVDAMIRMGQTRQGASILIADMFERGSDYTQPLVEKGKYAQVTSLVNDNQSMKKNFKALFKQLDSYVKGKEKAMLSGEGARIRSTFNRLEGQINDAMIEAHTRTSQARISAGVKGIDADLNR